MNERIKDLIKRNDGVRIKMMVGEQYYFLEHDLEKFVGSIVMDCVNIIENEAIAADTGIPSETNWGYISQLEDLQDMIKKHFDIEEK